jgi:hypothetical protein
MSQAEIEQMFKEARIDYDNEQAKEAWSIKDEATAIWAGNKISKIVLNDRLKIEALEEQKQAWIDTYNKQLQKLQEKIAPYDEAIEKVKKASENKINFFKYHLEKWLLEQKELDSKYSYSHPFVKTKFHTKPAQYKYDKESMLEWVTKNKIEDCINKKVTVDLKVKEFEAKIEELEDGSFVFKDTGEVLDNVEKVVYDRTVKVEWGD